MEDVRVPVCAICGQERSAPDHWFLIAESRWEDKLKILQWNDRLAAHAHCACSGAHVQELVVHWMTTGSLDYPFARVGLGLGRSAGRWPTAFWEDEVDIRGARQILELAVHRESMKRVLSESPQSLKTILDALLGALQRETRDAEAGIEAEDQAACAVSREI
jgi:hypothetical protein